jgi:hypothetical protein
VRMGAGWNGRRIMSVGRHVESRGLGNWLFYLKLIFPVLISDKNSNEFSPSR